MAIQIETPLELPRIRILHLPGRDIRAIDPRFLDRWGTKAVMVWLLPVHEVPLPVVNDQVPLPDKDPDPQAEDLDLPLDRVGAPFGPWGITAQ